MDNPKKIISQLSAHYETKFDAIKRIELSFDSTGVETINSLKHVAYGTAGFRGKANQIKHLFYKVGLIAGLRSLSTGRSNLGIMITASHNPVQDNGVKIIDANGSMLETRWEKIVEEFCNIPLESIEDFKILFDHLTSLMTDECQLDTANFNSSKPGKIMLGYDTRPTSEPLIQLVKLGLDAWAPLIEYEDYGQLTTPALHFLVGQSTLCNQKRFDLIDYYNKLASGLVECFKQNDKPKLNYDSNHLIVDNANGVGSLTMKYLCQNTQFKKCLSPSLINIFDSNDGGILNYECGADYVKSNHLAPKNATLSNRRYASLDGDADRVVYFYLEPEDVECRLRLLDGDKILALFAYYLIDLLKTHNITNQLSLGVIQTAYANGASSDFLSKQLGIQVDFADTGVKHLHKKALEYDFGIYFEANGHGTIWVSDKARAVVEGRKIVELEQLFNVLNNYTGDAVSDILIVETILNRYDWDIRRWDQMYEDRPSCLIKVDVQNRELVQTTNAGRTCVRPFGLQEQIDKLVKEYGPDSRSFVRASGTENVVRVYAECSNQQDASNLAKVVGEAVIRMCNK